MSEGDLQLLYTRMAQLESDNRLLRMQVSHGMDLVAKQSKRIMDDAEKLALFDGMQFAAFSSGWYARASLGHDAPQNTEALKTAYKLWIEQDSEQQ